jgi:hypothetical protein
VTDSAIGSGSRVGCTVKPVNSTTPWDPTKRTVKPVNSISPWDQTKRTVKPVNSISPWNQTKPWRKSFREVMNFFMKFHEFFYEKKFCQMFMKFLFHFISKVS